MQLTTQLQVFHKLYKKANNGIVIIAAWQQKNPVIKCAPGVNRTQASHNLWF